MRNRFVTTFLASLIGVIGLAACSDDDEGAAPVTPGGGGPGGGPRVLRLEEIRTQLRPLIEADCQWSFRCCNADERASSLGATTDVADCVERSLTAATHVEYQSTSAGTVSAMALRQLNRLGYGYDYQRIAVDTAAVQACASKLSTRACTPKPALDRCVPGEVPPIDDPCDLEKMLVGKQKAGEPCAPNSTDCLPELRCFYLSNGYEGVCVARAKVGETCFADSECGDKLLCDARTGRCVVGGDVGAACSFTDPTRPTWETTADLCRSALRCDTVTLKCSEPSCAGGASCNKDEQCPTGTFCVASHCGALAKDGEGCNEDDDCVNQHCQYDSTVGRTTCAAPAPDGATCQGNDDDCKSRYCEYDNGLPGYVCKPALAVGALCPNGDRQCASGRCRLDVAEMKCAAAATPGQTCDDNQDCSPHAKLYCVNTACTAPPFDAGVACTGSNLCKSGQCLDGKCVALGQVGAPCGADKPACDETLYCNGVAGAAGTCAPKKSHGAPCQETRECFQACSVSFGTRRCSGSGPNGAVCSGP